MTEPAFRLFHHSYDYRYFKLHVLGQNEGRRYVRKCLYHVWAFWTRFDYPRRWRRRSGKLIRNIDTQFGIFRLCKMNGLKKIASCGIFPTIQQQNLHSSLLLQIQVYIWLTNFDFIVFHQTVSLMSKETPGQITSFWKRMRKTKLASNGGSHFLSVLNQLEFLRYKSNYLFNQGNVLDIPYSSEDIGVHIGTYPRHGGDNQKWHIIQHE